MPRMWFNNENNHVKNQGTVIESQKTVVEGSNIDSSTTINHLHISTSISIPPPLASEPSPPIGTRSQAESAIGSESRTETPSEGWEVVPPRRRVMPRRPPTTNSGSDRNGPGPRPKNSANAQHQIYRIRDVHITLSASDITEGLRQFDIEKRGQSSGANVRGEGGRVNIVKSYNAPISREFQTVVTCFRKKPIKFPSHIDYVYTMSEEDRFRTKGTIKPRVDRNFVGITPFRSPYYDLQALEDDLQSTEKKTKWWPWLWLYYVGRLFGCELPEHIALDSVAVDIIVLTPPGGHAYRYWESDTGTGDMWIADFLPNEGFDKARISTYGAAKSSASDWQERVRHFVDTVEEFKEMAELKEDHSIILVEFIQGGEQSLALEGLREIGRGVRQGVVLIEEEEAGDQRHHDVYPEWIQLRQLRCNSLDHHQFRTNGSRVYRSIVDNIWTLMPGPQTTKAQGSGPDFEALVLRSNILKCLDDILAPLEISNRPSNGALDQIVNNGTLYSVLHDSTFKIWNETPGPSDVSEADVLRIVGPSDLQLTKLCGSSFGDAREYKTLHIDCETLGKKYGDGRGYWNGSALLGPVLLAISKLVMGDWMGLDGKPIHPGVKRLFECILENTRTPRTTGEVDSLHGLLVGSIESLGSNLVKVIENTLDELKCGLEHQGAVKSTKFIVAISNLHCLDKSPELGRLLYCIQKLHNWIRQQCTCKLLFTHEPREDLAGLLSGIPLIDGQEQSECLRSLGEFKRFNPKFIESRHDLTLDWLEKDPACQSWMRANGSSTLLIYGKPACGKSVLSKFLSEKLEAAKGPIVASFFFDESTQAFRIPLTMLQSLLYDILDKSISYNRSLFPHFQKRFQELAKRQKKQSNIDTSEIRIEWKEEDLNEIFCNILRHPIPETIYLLIDGLDEAENQVLCAQALTTALSNKTEGKVNFKLLVSFQKNAKAQRCLMQNSLFVSGTGGSHEITLEDKNSSDISAYIEAFLDDLSTKYQDWKTENIESHLSTLCEKSQGIFLWAKLAKQEITQYVKGESDRSLHEFEVFLNNIPKGLESLYEKLLSRVMERVKELGPNGDGLSKTKKMLEIVSQAKRPLTLDEFRDVYAIQPQHMRDIDLSTFSELSRFRPHNLKEIISTYTANILEVNRDEELVKFLHPTVVEFLRTKKSAIPGTPLLGNPTATDLTILGRACIVVLCIAASDIKDPGPGPFNLDEFCRKINNYPFIPYTLKHANDHLSSHPNEIKNLVSKLRESKSPILRLLQDWVLDLQGKVLPDFDSPTRQKAKEALPFKNDVLHSAASQGLDIAVKIALFAGADVESQSSRHTSKENALCLAIMCPDGKTREGSGGAKPFDTIRALLQHGADPKKPTRNKGTPLHYAAKYGNYRAVKLLLENGATIYARDARDMTPLHAAVIGFAEEDPRRDAEEPRESRKARLQCVELLVDNHPRLLWVNDSNGGMPIHWAAKLSDRLDIVKHLVTACGPTKKQTRMVDAKCKNKGTVPLHWASGFGNGQVVQYLIENNANVEQADIRGKTAINWASRYGQNKILETLIEALKTKADGNKKYIKDIVDKQERGGRTALIWAAQKGHIKCVRLLVEAGADVSLAEHDGEIGGTPISWAVTFGHTDIIDLLLCEGASLAAKCSEDRPLLGWAAASGNVDIYRKLWSAAYKQGLKLSNDEPDLDGRTPFMLAAARGNEGMLEYLFGLSDPFPGGIDVHHEDKEESTALYLPAGWGHLMIVQWLIETAGLDINHVNKYGDTPLHRAAYWRREAIIDYLISCGADTTLQNKKGLTYIDVLNKSRRKDER